MPLFRLLSDIHDEFGAFTFPQLDTDKDTTLLLAGDINLTKRKGVMRAQMSILSKQFKYVFYVFGNHEFYGTNMGSAYRRAKEWMDEFDNLFVLENDVNYVDGVAIIGATLWTDFDKENPILMNQVCDEYMGMNDYKQIRKGQVTVDPWNPDGVMSYGKISPAFLLHKHYVSRDYIFKQIAKEKKQGRKVIVMSHYGPTWMSIDKQYIGDSFNGAYVSDLSNEILDTEPDIWVHGHVHQSFDYMVGDCTRVICNPRGYYPTELNKNFNPTFSFELSGND